ncbi:hypothetical protein GCM10022223_05280 [Kineosporia mesophila]|uniref:Uncharacterized protein n=1 Tax=Kineosporia mesophila TaxID=566012 RepID=A0ABP6YYX4_9ACTN|nr:hypothetical protein [Kineosporia mesophila]MCD5354262.1 hypothetical protein [Kineosporia mesophila]
MGDARRCGRSGSRGRHRTTQRGLRNLRDQGLILTDGRRPIILDPERSGRSPSIPETSSETPKPDIPAHYWIVVLDIENFSSRPGPVQVRLRESMYRVVRGPSRRPVSTGTNSG